MPEKRGPDFLKNEFERWNHHVEKELTKRPERKSEFLNTSGIPIKRQYPRKPVTSIAKPIYILMARSKNRTQMPSVPIKPGSITYSS